MTQDEGVTEGGIWSFAEVCCQEGQHKAVSWNSRHPERVLDDGQCLPGAAESRTCFSFSSSILPLIVAEFLAPSYLLVGEKKFKLVMLKSETAD